MERLVNIANFLNGMMSGLSTEELNFFSTESNDCYLKELSIRHTYLISFDEEYAWSKKYFSMEIQLCILVDDL